MSNDHDKLTECYTLKIPKKTKDMLDILSESDHADLRAKIRIVIAKKLHEVRFDPLEYLGGEV